MVGTSYYAVAQGRRVGVFRNWWECKRAVDGYSAPVYKKFPTHAEAVRFVQRHGACPQNAVHSKKPSAKFRPKNFPRKIPSSSSGRDAPDLVSFVKRASDLDGATIVYTDGACAGNGTKRAKAGFGVFWGSNHPDNVCGPLPSGPPTNNRAEYSAVIAALEKAWERRIPKLVIRTDSNLLIESMTKWLPNWRENGWKTASGGAVQNRDLLDRITELMCQLDNVLFEKVEGHSGDFGNDQADALAKRGAEQYRPMMAD